VAKITRKFNFAASFKNNQQHVAIYKSSKH
jgi:hypothetical protein